MAAIFDHLIAIVVGVVLIGSLLVLQQRDRLAAVEATLADGARTRAETVLDVVARDTDNLLPRAQAAVLVGGPFATRIARTDSLTTEYTLATLVQAAPGGADVPAVVRYTLAATGDSALVDGRRIALHRLTRSVGGGPAMPLGETLADFGVAFGRAGQPLLLDGAPPDGVSHVRLRVAVAALGTGRAAHDRRSTRATLLARGETTVRPQNLGAVR